MNLHSVSHESSQVVTSSNNLETMRSRRGISTARMLEHSDAATANYVIGLERDEHVLGSRQNTTETGKGLAFPRVVA